MPAFTFRLEHAGRAPLFKIRNFETAAHAVERGRQLLEEWPRCSAVEISCRSETVARLVREGAAAKTA